MLETIAANTGAKYYHSPTQGDLAGIYQQIAYEVCQYGSISGCKFEDTDNDRDLFNEPKLSGWEIVLAGDASLSRTTDETGCYTFAGLLAGSYTVSEGENVVKQPFEQTYPAFGASYNITLQKGQNVTGRDFGNYLFVW